MILKTIDPKTAKHKKIKAGQNAEKQMAFYLERFFDEDESIAIINDLRLVHKNAVAQIDHLIIHTFGFIIIESKSVTTKVSINENGEWIRHYNGEIGMKSPINQSLLQLDLLKKLLNHIDDELNFKNFFGKKLSINKYKFDVLVAVSDQGIIERPNNLILSEIHKADQIPSEVLKLIHSYKSEHESFLKLTGLYHFHNSTVKRVGETLTKLHSPKVPSTENAINKEENTESKDEFQIKCKSCNSTNIFIQNIYGYKVKCRDCESLKKLQAKCPSCNKDDLTLKNSKGSAIFFCSCGFSTACRVEIVENKKQASDVKKECPKCGSELVERVAKKGENEGNKFWGCSGFPKCRYVEKPTPNK